MIYVLEAVFSDTDHLNTGLGM